MKSKPILLVAAAANRHTPAMQRAFDLARRAELPVHVYLPVHDPLVERSRGLVQGDVVRLAQGQLLQQRRAWLDALVARWRADGLTVTADLGWAPEPYEAILAQVLEVDPAVVIKDFAHESLPRELLSIALDSRLLRYCPVPLLLVREHSERLPRAVLAAIDTAPLQDESLNDLILREALKYAGYCEAEVDVAHVFPYVPFTMPPAMPEVDTLYTITRDSDRRLFDDFLARHKVPADRSCWLEGSPPERLRQAVRERESDLLVLGTTYRSALDRLFLGSTTEGVLFHLPCDVLLVKPPEFRAELERHVDLRALLKRVRSITPPARAAA